ncbi:MAG: DUF1648 domain-containing protein [Clostridia bacterium]|nr:DUF1648 domain-containing protein [Clostridia bacterium]
MKYFKWKIWLITSVVCLLPILLGLALWEKLPETLAIHFNIYGEPDNFASKGFVVFGLPFLMVVLQTVGCFVNDINAHKYGEKSKIDRVIKWLVTFVTLALYVATLGYGLGWNFDMRKVAGVLVAAILMVIGNYLPKFDYIKNYDLSTEKAKKINRFIGFATVIMGVLFLISVFLPPIWTVVCLILLIPYAIISAIYGIVEGRK